MIAHAFTSVLIHDGIYPSVEDARSGAWLYHACLQDIRAQDGDEHASLVQEAACINYIQGVADVGVITDAICSNRATFGTMVRVYVAYMQKNPKAMDAPRYLGAWLSLRESYPCQTKP